MAAPTAEFIDTIPRRGPRMSELWDIIGDTSVDGDTVAFKTQRMKRPQKVIGAVSATFSGQEVTVTLLAALAAGERLSIEVLGRPS
jgi:hypothetical protein